jgi:hypothetical protein
MNNDKELLTLAAKAAGIEIELGHFGPSKSFFIVEDGRLKEQWNPLKDDAQALRLAVKLKIDLVQISGGVCVVCGQDGTMDVYEYFNTHNNDPYAATRRAIVRAAAAIGQEMP